MSDVIAHNHDAFNMESLPEGVKPTAASRIFDDLHELFRRNSGAPTIDLSQILVELCRGLQDTWPVHRLTCEAEPLTVAAGKAIPVALILNELVTNAFKHACDGEHPGEMRVTLSYAPSREILLELRNLGRGLPAGFKLGRAADSLGMKVLGSLTLQLGGDLKAEQANPGARFLLPAPAATL